MKDKAEKYGILICVLADAKDPYAFRVIFHVTPPINNPVIKENTYDQVDKTAKNMSGDRRYSSIDIIEEPYQKKKTTNVGIIISCRKDLPVALKTAKGSQVLPSEFIWQNNIPVMSVSYCPKP